MRFAVTYHNDSNVKGMVKQTLMQAISQGVNLEQQPISTPFFQTMKNWPDMGRLMNLPLTMQCEEYSFEDGSLKCVRALVVDAEILQPKNETPKTSQNLAEEFPSQLEFKW